MVRLILPLSPQLSSVPAIDDGARSWAASLKDTLERWANVSLALPRYTVATRPVNPQPGDVIFVSDGGAGAVFQGWNGAAWVNLG